MRSNRAPNVNEKEEQLEEEAQEDVALGEIGYGDVDRVEYTETFRGRFIDEVSTCSQLGWKA